MCNCRVHLYIININTTVVQGFLCNNNSNNNSHTYFFGRSRVVRLDKRSEEWLGLKINGGNCVGIYVTGFQKQSLAEEAGVRIGDRLLQVRNCILCPMDMYPVVHMR